MRDSIRKLGAVVVLVLMAAGCHSSARQTEPLVTQLDSSASGGQGNAPEVDRDSPEALLRELIALPPCDDAVPQVINFDSHSLNGFVFENPAFVCDGESLILYADHDQGLVWTQTSGGIGGRVEVPRGPWELDEPVAQRLLLKLQGHASQRRFEELVQQRHRVADRSTEMD